MKKRSLVLAILLATVVIFAGACGGGKGIGGDVKLGDKPGGNGSGAIRGTETTTTLPPTTIKQAAGATTTIKAAAATTTTVFKPTAEIAILGDEQGHPFEPFQTAVYLGQTVRFVNKDVNPHIIQAAHNEFVTPSIPPGGHFDYKTDKPGTFQLIDQSRTYSQGNYSLTVQPR